MLRFLPALLLLALSPLSFAQVMETVEVHVVNVDVVVTDRAGNRIHGLTRNDFEVLEEGKRQTITNFYEVREESAAEAAAASRAAPAERPLPRRFAFFLDDDSLHPTIRPKVLASLRSFVEKHVRPGDEAALIRFSLAPKIAVPLTSNREAILAGIDRIANQGSPKSISTDVSRVQRHCASVLQMARSGRLRMLSAYDDCIQTVRQETGATTMESRRLLSAIDVAIATLSGGEAKRVLIFAGAKLPLQPGAEMFQWANHLFSPYLTGFNRPSEHAKVDDQEALVEKVAHIANASGVTLYLIHAPNTVDPNTVQSSMPVASNGVDFLGAANTAEAFKELAKITGGAVLSHPSNFDLAFDTIARDLTSYYSLGYKPSGDWRGQRPVTVRAKNRDYVVRARESYATKTFDDQMSDRVIANIFSAAPATEWAIGVHTGTPERDGRNFKVPIEVIIPPAVTLLPEGGKLAGGFTVYIAVGNEQGALSDVTRRPQPVTVTKEGEAELRREPFRFTATLTVRPGENWLSVGVADQVSHSAGFARATIVAR